MLLGGEKEGGMRKEGEGGFNLDHRKNFTHGPTRKKRFSRAVI